MEASQPKVGASLKGNVFVKVPLSANGKGHIPATRSGSAANPFTVEQLAAMHNLKNNLWNVSRRLVQPCKTKSPC